MSFLTQSYDQQITALSALAHHALRHWGLNVSACQLIAYTSNAVFYVKTTDGDFSLRVHRPNHKSLALIESERLWLETLSQSPNLRVPRPYLDIYHGTLAGIEQVVYVTLNHWIEGQAREIDALTSDDLYLIGQNVAHFHQTASSLTPPANFNRPRLDWDGLFNTGGAYDPKTGIQFFQAEHLALIAQATEIIRHTMNTLDQAPNTFGLIHGDLISKNIIFDEMNNIAFLDFEDSAYGYYLYDLTPIIWANRNNPYQDDVMQYLWEGYQHIRPQPANYRQHLAIFVMARHIASCRWVAGNADHPNLRGKVSDMIATRMIELTSYLERITKQPS